MIAIAIRNGWHGVSNRDASLNPPFEKGWPSEKITGTLLGTLHITAMGNGVSWSRAGPKARPKQLRLFRTFCFFVFLWATFI